jgi:hypothetical protein
MKVVCFNKDCRYNTGGECSREEIRVDELGMCIDARVVTQYPQEKIGRPEGKAKARAKKAD